MSGYCECGCGQKTELATYTSEARGWVKGQPKRFIRWHHAKVQFQGRPSAYDRIMLKVVKSPETDGCWDAGPATGRNWYGLASRDGKVVHNHRVVWEALNGLVPDGQVIRHRCDNMRCVRPDHLLLGTQADNINDAMVRGRMQRGSDRHNAKLTEDQVSMIRRSSDEGKDLAKRLGVSTATISLIRAGKTWRHVT